MRPSWEASSVTLASFNSRTLGRVRRQGPVYASKLQRFQFTHPGKGATLRFRYFLVPWYSFNSRTLGRVRLLSLDGNTCELRFNSRTLGRVRLSSAMADIKDTIGFNSRTLGRVRPIVATPNLSHSLFQFTHPGKGATHGHSDDNLHH